MIAYRNEDPTSSSGEDERKHVAGQRGTPTSPSQGEVGREADGSGLRFGRTRAMTARARNLRGNITDAERRLWQSLRRDQFNGLHFRRQHPIGPYTLDFYCPSLCLVVELDGGQHAEQKTKQADDRRSHWLAGKGIAVIRYWNNDVLSNLPGVLSDLLAHAESRMKALTPSLTLPLAGGGKITAVIAQQDDAAPSGGDERKSVAGQRGTLTSPSQGEVGREADGRGS